MTDESTQTDRLLQRLADGDRGPLERLLEQQRPYLRRLLEAKMEPELCQRMDPSDVIQETLATAVNRIEDYLERRPATFRLWLRQNALERLVDARRRHTAHKRDVKRDVRLSDVSSMAIVRGLLSGRVTEAVLRQELMRRVREAIMALSDTDREILEMRHTEELTNLEIAELLQVDPDTASKRYGRALRRLSEQLARMGVSHF